MARKCVIVRGNRFQTGLARLTRAVGAVAVAGMAASASAQSTWNAGGGADTSITLPANWGGTAPLINGTANVTFASAGSVATTTSDVFYRSILTSRASPGGFTVSGTGAVILRSSASSSTINFTNSSASTGTNTFSTALRISTNNADSVKLLVVRNNAARTLRFTGPVSQSSDSTVGFSIRFDGAAGSVTRFDGPISNLGIIQQSTGTAWAGELVLGGVQTNTAGSSITVAATGTGTAPTSAARLTLGEVPADIQTWNAITLNNVMTVNVGGTVTATTLSGSGAATVTGTGTLRLNSGTFGTNINVGSTLALVKQNAGTLTLSGTKAFTGSVTVNGGTLSLPTNASLAAEVNVNAGGTLSGEGSTSAALSFGAGVSTLVYDPATEPASFTAGSVVFAPGALVQISPSSAVTNGSTYTALKLSGGTFTGSPLDHFRLNSRGTLAFASADTALTVTPTAPATLTWRGNNGVNPSFWDIGTTVNFDNAGTPDLFYGQDTVTFDDTAASTTVAVQGSLVSPASVTFANASSGYTLTGGAVTIAGALSKSGAGSVDIANNLSTGSTISVSGGAITFGGTVTSTGTVSVTGGSTLTVNGSMTAPLSINNGTVAVTGSLNSPTSLTFNSGAMSVPGNLAVTGTLRIENERSLTVGGNLTATSIVVGTFNTPGSGTLAFTGAGTAAVGGAISVQRGLLDIGNRTVTLTGVLGVAGSDSSSANGGAASITSGPTGVVVLGGNFQIGNSVTTAAISVPANIDLGSASLATSPHGSYPYRGIITSFNPAYPDGVPFDGRLSGNVLFGPDTFNGTVVYGGDNTFTAGVHIRLGTMAFTKDAAMGAVPPVPTDWFNLAVGVIQLRGDFSTHPNRTFASMYGAITLTDPLSYQLPGIDTYGGTSTFAGAIVSRNRELNGFLKRGAGILTLTGTNTYTGPTAIEAGVLSVSSISNIGGGASGLGAPTSAVGGVVFVGNASVSSGTVAGSAGTLRYTGPATSTDRPIRSGFDGGAIESAGSGTLTLTGPVDARAWSMTLTGSSDGVITGPFNVDAGGLRGIQVPAGSGGTGYVPGATTVVINDPTGTGATARVLVNPSTGAVSAVEVLNAGRNYTSPTFTIVGAGTGASAVLPGNGIGSGSLTKSGTGTWTLAGSVTVAGNTTVTGGLLDVLSPLRPVTGSLVVTGPGASIRLAAHTTNAYSVAGEFASISVGTSGQTGTASLVLPVNPRSVSANFPSLVVTSALSMDPVSGKIDLGNNDLLVKGGAASLASAQSYAAAWYTSGGTAGLGSSVSAFTGLAVVANVDAFGLPLFASFDGVSVTTADLLVRHTYLGDTDLNGSLDARDFNKVLNGWSNGLSGWENGDVNYDGVVNASDFSLFLAAYTAGLPSLGSPADAGGGTGASVPEPTALGLLAPTGLLLARRRRR